MARGLSPRRRSLHGRQARRNRRARCRTWGTDVEEKGACRPGAVRRHAQEATAFQGAEDMWEVPAEILGGAACKH